jgi:hypothetical protein
MDREFDEERASAHTKPFILARAMHNTYLHSRTTKSIMGMPMPVAMIVIGTWNDTANETS